MERWIWDRCWLRKLCRLCSLDFMLEAKQTNSLCTLSNGRNVLLLIPSRYPCRASTLAEHSDPRSRDLGPMRDDIPARAMLASMASEGQKALASSSRSSSFSGVRKAADAFLRLESMYKGMATRSRSATGSDVCRCVVAAGSGGLFEDCLSAKHRHVSMQSRQGGVAIQYVVKMQCSCDRLNHHHRPRFCPPCPPFLSES